MVISPVKDAPAIVTSPPPTSRSVGSLPAPALVLGAMVSIQLGATIAKHLFEIAGAGTVACVRIALAGAIALLIWRPTFRVDRRALPAIAGLGISITAMNLSFYAAIERIPLGMAVTIEFLGPLAIALAGSRRWRDALCAVLAGIGVLLLVDSRGPVSWTGVLFALGAGVCWGSYIAFSAAVGRRTEGQGGLALAMAFGSILVLPLVFSQPLAVVLDIRVLIGAAAIAVLSSLVPHGIEMAALRRMKPSVFGVLMSLEPAVAAGVGLLLLGEGLGLNQWIGIGLVTLATAGAVRDTSPALTDA
ncbi:EamA family transporter [Nocardia sp. NPDC050710]|uniref:EamA family transporter n=1 Tax=Nocardia sp. NPDC050710 TaxID=3157220 RepID=UPI0033C8C7D9